MRLLGTKRACQRAWIAGVCEASAMPSQTDIDELVRVASAAAERGGDVVARSASGSRRPEGLSKSAGDYVTTVDHESEATIAAFLGVATPEIPLVGEEAGGDRASDERYWLVDPLDGTTNFLHAFPAVGVSVALVEEGRPIAGAVHAPLLGQTWTAGRGRGAWSRGRRLAVSTRHIDRAVVGTGFPFRRKDLLPRYLPVLEGALATFEDLRRAGAAALDLAWVAAGVFDGFFELALGPWDVAAGGLLIEEAGGLVTDWGGGPDYLGGDVLAGPPGVHAELFRLARESTPMRSTSAPRP
jgi:myo-inositol-1(or 4)-monophosphatase